MYEPSRGTFSVQPLLTSFNAKEPTNKSNKDQLSIDTEHVKKKAKINGSSFVQTENSTKESDEITTSSPYNIMYENGDIPVASKSKNQSKIEKSIVNPLRDRDLTAPSTTMVDWTWESLLEERKQAHMGNTDDNRRAKRNRCPSTCTVGLSDEVVSNEAATAALQRVLKKVS
jgi:hypothetical protein